jgi:hypothetical protein
VKAGAAVPAHDRADHHDRAARAGHLADRIGSRLLWASGKTLVAISLFLYSRLTAASSLAYLLCRW